MDGIRQRKHLRSGEHTPAKRVIPVLIVRAPPTGDRVDPKIHNGAKPLIRAIPTMGICSRIELKYTASIVINIRLPNQRHFPGVSSNRRKMLIDRPGTNRVNEIADGCCEPVAILAGPAIERITASRVVTGVRQ